MRQKILLIGLSIFTLNVQLSAAERLPPEQAQTQAVSKEIVEGRPLRNGIGRLSFESLRRKTAAGDIQLANAIKAVDKALWSAVLVAALENGGFCTATLVGPRVLLTAAHCVDAEKPSDVDGNNSADTITGTASFEGGPISILRCDMHPDYGRAPLKTDGTPRNDMDYALCELAAEVTSTLADSIDTDELLSPGSKVLLTGYGCTSIVVENGRFKTNDAESSLRLGVDSIDATGVLNSTAAVGNYLRTRSDGVDPVLCPGDSGGPAYRGLAIDSKEGTPRRISGVNSKVVAVGKNDGKYVYFSLMTTLASNSFRTFMADWVSPKGKYRVTRAICGDRIQPGQRSCRP